MPVHNAEIAAAFDHLADLLEIEGANPFRVRAYRRAARTVEDLPRSAAELIASGEDLGELPGIGADLAGKIAEFIATKHLAVLDEAKARLPAGLVELTNVPGIGPKRARALYDKLKVHSLSDLRKAATAGKLHGLPGFGVKSERKLLDELKRRREVQRRFRLDTAEDFAEPLLEHLKRSKGVVQATIAGSYRRRKDTVGDLDIVVAAHAGSDVMQRFVSYDEVDEVAAHGETRATVVLRSGFRSTCGSFPRRAMGQRCTISPARRRTTSPSGSSASSAASRSTSMASFEAAKRVAGDTEQSVYDQVRLPFIPPELREDRGEIAAAAAHKLPKLVELKDIRGDLHVHTDESDGKNTLREMAEAARASGYEYLAITDHSQHVTIAHGLDAKRVAKQIKAIDKLNSQIRGIRILKGIEVDILADGSLDLPDAILADLDFTVCAIHYKFDLKEAEQTERVLRAMDNPHFNIFAHPTGRLLGERAAYAIDIERILKAAKERGCCIELNAHPTRLDIDDHFCRLAKDMGVKIALGTDAHSIDGLQVHEVRDRPGTARVARAQRRSEHATAARAD